MNKRKRADEAARQLAHHGKPSGIKTLLSAPAKYEFEKFESGALYAAGTLRSRRLSSWFSAYFHPKGAVGKGATAMDVVVNLACYYFFFAIVFFMISGSLFYLTSAEFKFKMLSSSPLPSLEEFTLGMLVVNPVLDIIWMMLSLFLLFLCSKALGGKAGFAEQSNALVRVFCGSGMLMLVFAVAFLALSPFVDMAEGFSILNFAAMAILLVIMLALLFIMVAIFLYSLYGYFAVIREGNGFSSFKALFVMIGFVAILILLNIVADKAALLLR